MLFSLEVKGVKKLKELSPMLFFLGVKAEANG